MDGTATSKIRLFIKDLITASQPRHMSPNDEETEYFKIVMNICIIGRLIKCILSVLSNFLCLLLNLSSSFPNRFCTCLINTFVRQPFSNNSFCLQTSVTSGYLPLLFLCSNDQRHVRAGQLTFFLQYCFALICEAKRKKIEIL